METMVPPISQNQEDANSNRSTYEIYEIRVKGRLDGRRWAAHFEGMELETKDNESTILRGSVTDQAALYGLLSKLRNLNLHLLSVNQIGTTEP
jgi:hypothetical protein